MAYPEGYRKAMRTMQLADTFGFPLITFVDTPGAYPGVAAEQHGPGGAIGRSQAVMLRLQIPPVISPEACAAILWRDPDEKRKAAAAFKPDAAHCLELGVIDAVVPEPPGGAQLSHDEAARLLGDAIRESLEELEGMPGDELRRRRRARFRALGVFA